jgi:WD40 repeat protein
MIDFPRLPIFDVRLLGAIVAALIALSTLSKPGPEKKLARSQVVRGEPGVQVTSIAFSPTGKQIATTNTAGRLTLRTREGGWRIERFLNFAGYARSAAFSSDGQFLAAAGIAPHICVWDMTAPVGEPALVMTVPIRRALRLLFSPDGKCLAVTSDLDGTILLFDLAARRERMVLHHPSPVTSIAFSPDGRWLATGGKHDWSILLWDLQTGACRILLEHGPGPAMALAFSPDGALLASASFPEHHARLWELTTGQVCRIFEGHSRSLNSIAFSPDGSLLATAGNDGMLGLWKVATGQRLVSLDSQATWLRAVDFSTDGQTLVLATGDDDDVRLWDLAPEDEAIASAMRHSSK